MKDQSSKPVLRPIVQYKNIQLDKLTPLYFKELFKSLPPDGLDVMAEGLDGKMSITELYSDAIFHLCPYYGAIDAFEGLVPVQSEWMAAWTLTNVMDGTLEIMGDTPLERLINYCDDLHTYYEANPHLPYGIFLMARVKTHAKYGREFTIADDIKSNPDKGDCAKHIYKYADWQKRVAS